MFAVAETNHLMFSGDFTMECWLRVSPSSSGPMTVFENGDPQWRTLLAVDPLGPHILINVTSENGMNQTVVVPCPLLVGKPSVQNLGVPRKLLSVFVVRGRVLFFIVSGLKKWVWWGQNLVRWPQLYGVENKESWELKKCLFSKLFRLSQTGDTEKREGPFRAFPSQWHRFSILHCICNWLVDICTSPLCILPKPPFVWSYGLLQFLEQLLLL